MTPEEKAENQPDRRSARRYKIEQVLYYKRCGRGPKCERGKTVDISSAGVRFTTESSKLNPGDMVELSMNWPAVLGRGCALKLHILGYVVRSVPESAVATIVRYEFRTRREPAEIAAAIPTYDPDAEVSFGRRSWLSSSSS